MDPTTSVVMAALAIVSLCVQGVFKLVGVINQRKSAPSKSSLPPGPPADFDARFRVVEKQVDDLHDWHNVSDPTTGVKSWIVSPEWLQTLKAIEKHVGQQTNILARLRDLAEDKT